MKQHLKVILTREKTTNVGLSTISAEQCCSGHFNNHHRDRPASFFALTENHTLVLYVNTARIIFSIFLYNANVFVIYQSKIPNQQGLLSSLLHIPNERRKLRFLEHFLFSPVLGLAPVLPLLLPSHQWDLQSPVLLNVININANINIRPPEHRQN